MNLIIIGRDETCPTETLIEIECSECKEQIGWGSYDPREETDSDVLAAEEGMHDCPCDKDD